MSRLELPNGYIPLPLITNHTNQVRIDSLGLPVGFDETQLGVNLKGFDSVRRLIGADVLRITCQVGPEAQLAIHGDINTDGSLASSAVASAQKTPASSAKVEKKIATVELDSSAIGEKHPELNRAIRSASTRAIVLNKVIKSGLSQAAYRSLELDDAFGAIYTTMLLAVGSGAAMADGGFTPKNIVEGLGVGPFIWLLYARDYKNFAILPFWPADRYAVTRGKIATTKFFAKVQR